MESIKKYKMLNNKGFSLIEAMIGMSLVCLIALAFSQITINMGLSQNLVDFKLSSNSLASSMLLSLVNPLNCNKEFSGIQFDSTLNTAPISFNMPTRTLSNNVSIPEYKLSISDLSFVNYKLVSNNSDGSNTYFGDLSLTTKASRKVLGSNYTTNIVASIYLTTSGNTIISCEYIIPSPTPSPIPTAIPSPTPTACNDDKDNGQSEHNGK